MGIEERRERERLERKKAIVDATIEFMNKRSYYATTMEKIAESAELSRATHYLHFNTKDDQKNVIYGDKIQYHLNWTECNSGFDTKSTLYLLQNNISII